MQYRREIDGLRALAVIPVILFHGGIQAFSGGYVGVDVFFVISGYLITSIIITKKKSNTFSLVGFYENRARRILPALFFVMLVCLPFAWLWMVPAEMKDFSRSLMAVPLFASNILFYFESGYFDSAAELRPLLHTWSLAVEEQYYLLFPLFLLLTWRLRSRWPIAILAVVAILSLVIAQRYSLRLPQAAFYLLPTRGWELLIGVFIAFHLLDKKIDERDIANNSTLFQFGSIGGIILIVFSIVAFDENTPFPGVYALIPTVGTAFVILFATPHTLVGKLLGNRVLVGIGLISYSAYLWHQPLFAFARLNSFETLETPLILFLTFCSFPFAYLSWRYVEQPFRRPNSISRSRLLFFAVGTSVFFFFVGFLGQKTNGYENIYFESRLNATEKEMFVLIKKHTGATLQNLYRGMGDDGSCNFWAKDVDEKFIERFKHCSDKYGKAIVVLGDSHAMNIYNALYRANTDKFLVSVSKAGCRPHRNYEICQYDDFKLFVSNNAQNIKTVIFNQAGVHFLRDLGKSIDSETALSAELRVDLDYENTRKVSDYLNDLARFGDVVWLGPFVETGYDFRNVRKIVAQGLKINQEAINVYESLDVELNEYFATKDLGFRYVSLTDILQITPEFLKIDDCVTYRNEDHFSICGEKIVGEKIKQAFRPSDN